MLKALLALVPSAGVLFLFVVAIKAMLEADRRERSAQAAWERDRGVESDTGGTATRPRR